MVNLIPNVSFMFSDLVLVIADGDVAATKNITIPLIFISLLIKISLIFIFLVVICTVFRISP